MTKDQALKHALEKFEYMNHIDSIFHGEFDFQINVIKKALAQQVEPVAIVDSTITGHIDWLCTFFPKQGTKLYTSPPVATNDTSQERVVEIPKQRHEPCGLECDCTDVCKQDNYKALWEQMCERCDELDKQLAQRTWAGLTDEEMQDLWDRYAHMEMMRAIESKLKEKNT